MQSVKLTVVYWLLAPGSYMHVCTVARATHEDPVSFAGLRHGRQEVGTVVVLPQNISR